MIMEGFGVQLTLTVAIAHRQRGRAIDKVDLLLADAKRMTRCVQRYRTASGRRRRRARDGEPDDE